MAGQRKLGRTSAHRWSMLRCALLHHRLCSYAVSACAASSCSCVRSSSAPSLRCKRFYLVCLLRAVTRARATRFARTMVSQLINHERIETTVQKARLFACAQAAWQRSLALLTRSFLLSLLRPRSSVALLTAW
jgi:hypothetical protein